MGLSARLAGIAPWTALIAAGAGWALHQQVVAQSLHFDCHATAGVAGIGWGLFSLALVFVGTAVSWRARPGADDGSALAAVRRFAVYMGVMAAMLATLGIVFQILAAALLPGCRP
jgi:hypothetical protein